MSDIRLHPQVILSIADHYSRRTVQAKSFQRVIGALMGKQTGQKIEVTHTLEINPNRELAAGPTSSSLSIETELFEIDLDLFKKVFPQLEMLGWYSTAASVQDGDLEFHCKVISHWNENPIYLILDPCAPASSKELPISIFESEIHLVKDIPLTMFVKSSFQLEAEETERVIVDHVARIAGAQEKGAPVASVYHALVSAIASLQQRIGVLLQYLQDVASQQALYDDDILRSIKTIINRLPAMEGETFKRDFFLEYNDSKLLTYLASLTEDEAFLNETIDKYNLAFGKSSRERVMRHM